MLKVKKIIKISLGIEIYFKGEEKPLFITYDFLDMLYKRAEIGVFIRGIDTKLYRFMEGFKE